MRAVCGAGGHAWQLQDSTCTPAKPPWSRHRHRQSHRRLLDWMLVSHELLRSRCCRGGEIASRRQVKQVVSARDPENRSHYKVRGSMSKAVGTHCARSVEPLCILPEHFHGQLPWRCDGNPRESRPFGADHNRRGLQRSSWTFGGAHKEPVQGASSPGAKLYLENSQSQRLPEGRRSS